MHVVRKKYCCSEQLLIWSASLPFKDEQNASCAHAGIDLAGRPMQVRTRKKNQLGAVAKGPTSEEFEDVMSAINEKAGEVMMENPEVFNAEKPPLFSFDNPKIHEVADLSRAGISRQAQRVPLPPRSPDMHKVIEHCFGILSRAMNTSLMNDPSINSIQAYKAEIVRLFHTCITPQSIQADVASLIETYSYIAKQADGGWPPANLR